MCPRERELLLRNRAAPPPSLPLAKASFFHFRNLSFSTTLEIGNRLYRHLNALNIYRVFSDLIWWVLTFSILYTTIFAHVCVFPPFVWQFWGLVLLTEHRTKGALTASYCTLCKRKLKLWWESWSVPRAAPMGATEEDATPARRRRATRWRTCWPSRPSSSCQLHQPPVRPDGPTRPPRLSPSPFRIPGDAMARPAAFNPRVPDQMPRPVATNPVLNGHLRPAAASMLEPR